MTRFTVALLPLVLLAACSDPLSTARFAIDPAPAQKTLPNRLGQAELREVSLPQYASDQEIARQTEDGALRSTPKEIWADDPPRAGVRSDGDRRALASVGRTGSQDRSAGRAVSRDRRRRRAAERVLLRQPGARRRSRYRPALRS